MSTIHRLAFVWVLVFLVGGFTSSPSAFAQKFGFGGFNKNSSNHDDDDQNNHNNQDNNSSQHGNSQNGHPSVQQFQQMLQGGQSGQGGSNQFRNSGQQFQNQQQFQNLQHGGQNNWQTRNWQGSRNIQSWVKVFNNGPQPFSDKWYDDHPKAWQLQHNHAQWDDDVWIVATTAGVAAWLGWGDYPHGNTTVVYGYVPGGAHQVQIVDPNAFGDWYPLGVFSLLTGPFDGGTRIVQLAIDRQGTIRGTYYDIITNTAHNVSGGIKRKSQRVYWSLNSNQAITFRAPLDQLTQPQGVVTVSLPGGEQQWQLIRLENYGNAGPGNAP